MNQVLTTVPAHFDGSQIRLDVKAKLKPGTRLLITILDESVLDDKESNEALVRDAMKASEAAFDRVWDNDEDAAYDLL